MSRPIDRAAAEGFSLPHPRPAGWDAAPPREGDESWRYVRRNDLAQLAVPFVLAGLRDGDGALATDEAWRDESGPERDGRIVERAVRLARMLQDEVDRARPRA